MFLAFISFYCLYVSYFQVLLYMYIYSRATVGAFVILYALLSCHAAYVKCFINHASYGK